MLFAVEDDGLDIHHRISGDHAIFQDGPDAFFDRREVRTADGAAEDFAGEFVAAARWEAALRACAPRQTDRRHRSASCGDTGKTHSS